MGNLSPLRLFRMEVDSSNLSSDFNNEGYSWYTKFTSDFKLPAGIGLQFTGNYTAPRVQAQGTRFSYYYLDASLTRSFFNERARVSLTREFRQTYERKRETRIFLLNLRYRLIKSRFLLAGRA